MPSPEKDVVAGQEKLDGMLQGRVYTYYQLLSHPELCASSTVPRTQLRFILRSRR